MVYGRDIKCKKGFVVITYIVNQHTEQTYLRRLKLFCLCDSHYQLYVGTYFQVINYPGRMGTNDTKPGCLQLEEHF